MKITIFVSPIFKAKDYETPIIELLKEVGGEDV